MNEGSKVTAKASGIYNPSLMGSNNPFDQKGRASSTLPRPTFKSSSQRTLKHSLKRKLPSSEEGPPSKLARVVKKVLPGTVSMVVEVKDSDEESNTSISELERPKKRRKKISRQVVSFSSNVTISRGSAIWDEPVGKHPCDIDITGKDLGKTDFEDRVEDHSSRRVLIFYYLLLIYYQEGCTVELDKTNLQHGTAKCGFCNAAHSAILPHVKDDYYTRLGESIRNKGVTKELEGRLSDLGVSPEKMAVLKARESSENKLSMIFSDEELVSAKGLIPESSPFYQVMNSTVEMDSKVNWYDCVIEGVMRPKALAILNQVSSGTMKPYEGVKVFVAEMRSFFRKSKEATEKKLELLDSFQKLELECRDFEIVLRRGKKRKYHEQMEGYLNSLIELRKVSRNIERLDKFSSPLRLYKRMNRFKPIFGNIWSTYYKEKSRIEQMDTVDDLKAYIEEACDFFEDDDDMADALTILKGYEEIGSTGELEALIFEFFKKGNLGSILMFIDGEEALPMSFVLDKVKERHQGAANYLEWERSLLDADLKIMNLQRDGTEVPKYELVSGKMQGDTLVGLNDEELLEQKQRILRYQYQMS